MIGKNFLKGIVKFKKRYPPPAASPNFYTVMVGSICLRPVTAKACLDGKGRLKPARSA
jgi:hypothetical protein